MEFTIRDDYTKAGRILIAGNIQLGRGCYGLIVLKRELKKTSFDIKRHLQWYACHFPGIGAQGGPD